MSQWAEIRHLHLVEGVPKKEIARRLKLDVKTVRRAVDRPTPPVRVSPPRAGSLDPWRDQIEQWLREDRKLTAKTGPPVAAAVGRRGLPAHGAPLRRGAAEACHLEGGLRAPQRGSRHDDGGRLRRVVGRHRRRAVQGGAFPISRSRAHTHRRHGHPQQTVPSAGLIERPQEKNRVDALR